MFVRRFFLPSWVKKQTNALASIDRLPDSFFQELRQKLGNLTDEHPDVSIIIPAYNEETNILRTLASLAEVRTRLRVELIVANNNSTDRTQAVLDRCGVRSILVTDQGVAYARQEGLIAAKGTYVLNGDSDCLYPPTWIDSMVEPLQQDSEVVCTYGYYSFIPSEANSRFKLAIYEWAAELFTLIKKRNREVVDVRGMNFAFRRADALAVGGFDTSTGHRSTFTGSELTSGKPRATGRCEDGWLALCLSERGKLMRVKTHKARNWTTDRTLMADGSLGTAFTRRVRKELGRIEVYLNPAKKATTR